MTMCLCMAKITGGEHHSDCPAVSVLPPPEMHTAAVMQAMRQDIPFSIWQPGALVGFTVIECEV